MIVEQGNGLSDANSYVSIVYADNYFSARGVESWFELDDEKKEILLVNATDYIDNVFKWKGIRGSRTQSLSFPRKHIFVDGYEVIGVPTALINAVCECALLMKAGTEMYNVQEQNGTVVSESIGSISITYDNNGKPKDETLYDKINKRLRGLYCDTSIQEIVSAKVERV